MKTTTKSIRTTVFNHIRKDFKKHEPLLTQLHEIQFKSLNDYKTYYTSNRFSPQQIEIETASVIFKTLILVVFNGELIFSAGENYLSIAPLHLTLRNVVPNKNLIHCMAGYAPIIELYHTSYPTFISFVSFDIDPKVSKLKTKVLLKDLGDVKLTTLVPRVSLTRLITTENMIHLNDPKLTKLLPRVTLQDVGDPKLSQLVPTIKLTDIQDPQLTVPQPEIDIFRISDELTEEQDTAPKPTGTDSADDCEIIDDDDSDSAWSEPSASSTSDEEPNEDCLDGTYNYSVLHGFVMHFTQQHVK